MPGTTSLFGWPKPLPGDPVAQGAETMGKALDELDKSFALPSGAFNGSEPYTSYPIGTSILNVTGSNSGWPYGTGMVVTFRLVPGGGWVTQMFTPRTSVAGVQGTYIRYGYGQGVWSDWICFTGPGVPKSSASGSISVTTVNNIGSATISFPAGRFTTPPKVFVSMESTAAIGDNVAGRAVTTALGSVTLRAPSGTTATVNWYAVEEH